MRVRRTLALTAAAVTTMALAGCLGQQQESDTGRNADAKDVTLTVTANAVAGGKNELTAKWVTDWVIPEFTTQQKDKGVNVTVKYDGIGVDDADYKAKIALDFNTDIGGDVVEIDGIWLGEFAQGGQVRPLDDVVGKDEVDRWDGWGEIPDAVQAVGEFEDKRYGIPVGTDGRVIFFNKKLFAQVGLPADWQPTSWDEITAAAVSLKQLPGVIPMQLNAGTAMTEATTMQGVLPLLASTGAEINQDGKWQGATENVKQVLDFYQQVYGGKLGDPLLAQEAKGRDKSFELFAQNKVGMLFESDYFWRSVVDPTVGVAKMADRDAAVGWAKIPAMNPGAGVGGQDFVSMSGGSVRVINPNTKYPQQAWELLEFMNSAAATKARLGDTAQVTQRQDVNEEVLQNDPMLSFIAEEVLPITRFRPGLADYPKVSSALQQATADVIAGKSADEAAAAYQDALVKEVGEDKVARG
ncbi:extracellular solute-binding protein [Actinophytocola algeriensis]|uniref:Multiple sugar transport system substrate-binding protein n=1 Tax=Actinophytocola algeriensis TaxID=1768010 RepID=A0A7W7QAY9_9PSEU|nr:extracellular solute-binding protein [Actinophytocola algeriensis]MBB4910310.1 multiple sugar transport system substrate-binding protein [Actinophytocola algeriensis]MBE1480701.1 multiple sugar transport system substrate-binding protein [Actinophytocola algeriensis]